MSSIDIRNTNDNPVTIVEYEDNYVNPAYATSITKEPDGKINLGRDTWEEGYNVHIPNEKHAKNLIKALQYTIDNNWYKE